LHNVGDTGPLRYFLPGFISKVELGYNQARIHYTFSIDSIDPNMLSPSRGTKKPPPMCGFMFQIQWTCGRHSVVIYIKFDE
jgi:hypothetical protein